MHFLADMSSPSCLPVFDVHPNPQDQLDRFQVCYDKANAYATSQLAAGSTPSPPFPLTSPPSQDIYSFDQWTPLLNSDISSDLNLGYCFGPPVSSPSFIYGSQDSASSSPNSSYVILTSLLILYTTLPRSLARLHPQLHHLWGTIVYCILLPQTCSHMIRQTLSKRVRLVVKISPFQLYPTKVILLRGRCQRIYLTLFLLYTIYTRPPPCPGH